MKRKLSILLAATMVTSMLPTGVFAASINNVTSTPSMTMNSEWSLKEGNVDVAPQIIAKATTKIEKGEQITLTLNGAEWAFYDTGNFSLDEKTNNTSTTDIVRSWGNIRTSNGVDDSTNNNISKIAPWVPETTNSIQANGTAANSQARANLAAAALLYPQSVREGEVVDKPDDIPSVDDETDEAIVKDVTDKVYARLETSINTSDSIYRAYGTALDDYIKLKNDTTLSTRKKTYDDAKTDYENRKKQYETATTQTLKDGYKVLMDEAYNKLVAAQVSYQEYYDSLKIEDARKKLVDARTALINRIADIKSEIKTKKATMDSKLSTLQSAVSVYNSEKAAVLAGDLKAIQNSTKQRLVNAANEYIQAEYEYKKVEVNSKDEKLAYDKYWDGTVITEDPGNSFYENWETADYDKISSLTPKAKGSKVVTAINFEDVVFEAANIISFRLNTDMEINDKIAIPILAKVYADAPTINLTSATGKFSNSTYQFAKVSSGSTVPTISSAVSFYDTADLYPIVITETTPGSFRTNERYTNYIRMTLPAGFNWVKTGTASVTGDGKNVNSGTYDVTGWLSSNNSSIINNGAKGKYADGAAIIDPKDNGIATIVLNKSSYNLQSNMLSKIILNEAKIQSKKSIAKEGDVKINMKGENFNSTSLVIAKFGTYGINLTVDKVPDRIAGRSYLNDEESVKSGKVTFEENVESSWWAERRTEFVVNMGDIRAVDVKVLDDVTQAGNGVSGDEGISHSELVNGVTVTNAVEDLSGEKINADRDALNGDNRTDYKRGYFQGGDRDFGDYMYISSLEGKNRDFRRFVLNEFDVKSTIGNFVSGERKTKAKMELTFYVEVPATLDPADKDLTLSLEGASITDDDKQKLKITNIKEPLTFDIQRKDVNLGYKDVELGTITITENFKEGFAPVYNGRNAMKEDDLKLLVLPKDQAKGVSLSVGQMDGDFNKIADTPGSVKDGQVVGDILVKDGKIYRQSTEITKVTITPKIDLVRYIPEGKYDFKIDGIDELGSDVTIEDYINVITAAENKNTKYASDVKIVADGSTTTMTVGGVSKSMTAAAFIKDDRTMLPLRDVANALGISDDGISFYDGMATIFANGTFVQATSGSKELKINGASIPMDTEAFIDPATERMYLPLGFIANAFGVEAKWDGTTKTATLNPSVPVGTPSTQANVSTSDK